MAAKNYGADDIKTISGTKHMRLRPGMWGFQFGSVKGNVLMIKEIIDNSIDESIDPNKTYPIDVLFLTNVSETDYQVIVRDRGRGIPVDKLIDSVTKVFTSGKYDGDAYDNTRGTNGVALKCLAAFSDECIVMTKRMDGYGFISVTRGDVNSSKITHKPLDKNLSSCGTIVMFRPDKTIIPFTTSFIKDGLTELIDLVEFYTIFKHNTVVNVRKVKGIIDAHTINDTPEMVWRNLVSIIEEERGELLYKTDNTITPRTYIQNRFGIKKLVWELGALHKIPNMELEPLGYDIDLFLGANVSSGVYGYRGAVNGTPIDNQTSTHIDMLQTVLKMQLDDFIDNDEIKQFFNTKYFIPVSGYILVTWKGAEFIGQDKTRFENRKFGDLYRSSLRKQFNKIPLAKWECLYEAIKENLESEYAKYTKTAYKLTKNLKGIGYSLNRIGSFHNCVSTDRSMTELFITEGDSAGGRVKAVRDAHFQAILKLSGKPFNAIKGDNKKCNANAIYQDMVRLVGVSPSDKNLDNMNFNKIIIMTDADDDGCHIVALLIGIFYKINPLILEQGRVLVTNPPLYSTLLKNQAVYLRDENALEQSRITSVYRILLDVYIKTSKTEIQLNEEQFMAFCYLVKRIGRITTTVANMLNVEPLVLEQLIHCVDYLEEDNVDTKKIKEILKVDDVVWNKDSNNIILIDAGLEFPIPLTRLASEIRAYILPEYEVGKWKQIQMFVTTKYSDLYLHQPCTYMMLYDIFEKLDTCYSIRRFKGLGEMSEAAIEYTCVDPKTRCYSTIHSIGEVKRIFDMLGVDTDARKKLIDTGYVEQGD